MAKLGYDGKRKEVGGKEQQIGNVKEIKRNKQRLNGVKITAGDAKKLLTDRKLQNLAQMVVYTTITSRNYHMSYKVGFFLAPFP